MKRGCHGVRRIEQSRAVDDDAVCAGVLAGQEGGAARAAQGRLGIGRIEAQAVVQEQGLDVREPVEDALVDRAQVIDHEHDHVRPAVATAAAVVMNGSATVSSVSANTSSPRRLKLELITRTLAPVSGQLTQKY